MEQNNGYMDVGVLLAKYSHWASHRWIFCY